MKKIYLIVFVLSLGITSSLFCQPPSSLANIDAVAEYWMGLGHTPGMAICVIKGDSIVYSNNYGYANLADSTPVTNNTMFYVYSIGKSITSSCAMQCFENGQVGLDDNINNILPFDVDNPNHATDSITIRMLASHTASLQENVYDHITIGDAPESLAAFLGNFYSAGGLYYSSNNFLPYTPGSHYHYANYGTGLLGYTVEVLNGVEFKQYARDSMFLPLGMEKTTWFLSELDLDSLALGYEYIGGQLVPRERYGNPAYPGLSLKSTTHELAAYICMLLNKGTYKDSTVLSPASVDEITTVQFPWADETECFGLWKTVISGETSNKEIWMHNGGGSGGFTGSIQFCPAENTAVVYLTNMEQVYGQLAIRLFDYAAMVVIPETTSQVIDTSFTATWQVAPDADNYLIDVAGDIDFANVVPGYQDYNLGPDTFVNVTGLTADKEYFCRIRAINSSDTGAYSGTISVHTTVGIDEAKQASQPAQIWASGNTVFVNINDFQKLDEFVHIYNLEGKLIAQHEVSHGLNSFYVPSQNQAVLVKLQTGKTSISKKVVLD